MNISFRAIGLIFDADVDYEPVIHGRYSGPPEDCYPDEGGTVEFNDLTVDGQDASFLLESSVSEDIIEAAQAAAYDAYERP